MPKFSASSAADFRTEAANAGRVARVPVFVVIVEADDGSWCELDAESITHAERLAMNWVDTLGARGACVWGFDAVTGKLNCRCEFDYFEVGHGDVMWCS
jgi:hypothetical protein